MPNIPEDKLPEREQKKDYQTMTSGQWLWKTAKPIGCIIVLVMFVVFLVFCFTSKPPVPAQVAALVQLFG